MNCLRKQERRVGQLVYVQDKGKLHKDTKYAQNAQFLQVIISPLVLFLKRFVQPRGIS